MRATWLFLAAAATLAAVPAIEPQKLNPSARDILNLTRPLQPAEIESVLAAARQALEGKTFRLSYQPGGPGLEILMGLNGRPRYIRMTHGFGAISGGAWASSDGGLSSSGAAHEAIHVDLVTFIEYTSLPARRCDGGTIDGELVIEYEHRSDTGRWTAQARTRTPHEVAAALFDQLSGSAPVASGERRRIGERFGRAIMSPFTVPSDLRPVETRSPGMTQSLWIDTESLLPLRWSIAIPANPDSGTPAIPDYGLSFSYSPFDLRPPEGLTPPGCIQ